MYRTLPPSGGPPITKLATLASSRTRHEHDMLGRSLVRSASDATKDHNRIVKEQNTERQPDVITPRQTNWGRTLLPNYVPCSFALRSSHSLLTFSIYRPAHSPVNPSPPASFFFGHLVRFPQRAIVIIGGGGFLDQPPAFDFLTALAGPHLFLLISITQPSGRSSRGSDLTAPFRLPANYDGIGRRNEHPRLIIGRWVSSVE